jgi:hypothetical protein
VTETKAIAPEHPSRPRAATKRAGSQQNLKPTRPAPPKGIGPAGRELWTDIVGRFELESHELLLLKEAARCADDLDDLAATVAAEGRTTADGKIHPALTEARQLRIVLPRLIGSLRIPAADDVGAPSPIEQRRPQRRGAARGVYPINGLA